MKDSLKCYLCTILGVLAITGMILIQSISFATAQAEQDLAAGCAAGRTSGAAYVVIARKLNVRWGPDEFYPVTDKLKRGTKVTVVGEEGEWWGITYPGGSGYVSKAYLSPASH